ncbi:MAG: PH domain-containing protein [Prolixibacteraceae bacterium]
MSNIDLTTPTRQSPRGVILIFLFSAQKFIRTFWPLLLLLIFQNRWFQNQLFLVASLIALMVLLLVHTVFYYLHFFFYVSGDEFVLKKGYLRKQTLSIPFDRIQSVNTKQNLIQQLLNVVTLEIDTAGTAAKELKIHALDKSYATELQNQLRKERKRKAIPGEDEHGKTAEVGEEEILQLSPADLLKIGISQNHIKAALVILAFGMQLFQRIENLFEEQAEEYSGALVQFLSESGWALLTFMILFFLLVAIVFSLANVVLKYFGFRLMKKEGTYRIESGLLNKRNVIIPHHKLQELNWETGPLKKIFGIYHLVFKQAVSGQNRRRQQLVDAPGCLGRHLELLKSDLFGKDELSAQPKIHTNRFYFNRLWMLYGWMPVIAATLFFYSEWQLWLGAAFWLPGSAGYCYLKLKKRYFRINNSQLRISKGAVSDKWKQMKLHKLQAVEFRQTIFQKRRSLASLRITNAAGTMNIPYIDEELAKKMVDYLLYHTEISEEPWM